MYNINKLSKLGGDCVKEDFKELGKYIKTVYEEESTEPKLVEGLGYKLVNVGDLGNEFVTVYVDLEGKIAMYESHVMERFFGQDISLLGEGGRVLPALGDNGYLKEDIMEITKEVYSKIQSSF